MSKTKDEILNNRIRPMLSRRNGFSEKKMFGSVWFMINSNMCVGTWKGSLVVRLDRVQHDSIQAEPWMKEFDITGKLMKAWALVTPRGIKDDDN